MPDGEVDDGDPLDADETHGPTRGRAASLPGCTSARGPSMPVPSRGPTRRGPAGSSRARVVYELAPRHVHPRGHPRRGDRRLDHLGDLGVDLVEPMPVNAFNGTHNWGYDGVAWFAVGRDLRRARRRYQRFVDACHAHGLGVVQDVVYNHLGPVGELPCPCSRRT